MRIERPIRAPTVPCRPLIDLSVLGCVSLFRSIFGRDLLTQSTMLNVNVFLFIGSYFGVRTL